MTTIIGIVASDNQGVVLASDTQYNKYEGTELVTKTNQPKIIFSTQQGWAAAGDGSSDQTVDLFEAYLLGTTRYSKLIEKLTGQTHRTLFTRKIGEKSFTQVTDPRYRIPRQVRQAMRTLGEDKKNPTELEKLLQTIPPEKRDDTIDGFLQNLRDSLSLPQSDPINEAIQYGYFQELVMLNSRTVDTDLQANTYLIAANQPTPKLYHANIFGMVTEVTGDGVIYEVTGSGTQIVLNYFNDETYNEDPLFRSLVGNNNRIDTNNITLKIAKALAMAAMKKAMRDANTGGLIDYAIITPKGVHSRGNAIRQEYEKREEEILRQEVELNHE